MYIDRSVLTNSAVTILIFGIHSLRGVYSLIYIDECFNLSLLRPVSFHKEGQDLVTLTNEKTHQFQRLNQSYYEYEYDCLRSAYTTNGFLKQLQNYTAN